MQERAVQPHAMVDHQQMPFEREGIGRCERDHAIGGSDINRSGGCSDIHPAMIAAGRAIIDPLGAEQAGNPTRDRTDKLLPPAIAFALKRACCVYARKFRSAAGFK